MYLCLQYSNWGVDISYFETRGVNEGTGVRARHSPVGRSIDFTTFAG